MKAKGMNEEEKKYKCTTNKNNNNNNDIQNVNLSECILYVYACLEIILKFRVVIPPNITDENFIVFEMLRSSSGFDLP